MNALTMGIILMCVYVLCVFYLYKDLLQNIPGSVLTANLYEKFIDVLDEGNEEAKIAMILR